MRFFAAAFACSIVYASPALADQAAPVTVDGLVQHPQSLATADLKALAAITISPHFDTMHGASDHHWTGPLLWTLVTKAELKDEPGVRTFARHALLVTGKDGYAATIAIGEIDPALEGKQVILALSSDGADLSAPHLVVPGDKHGARDVHEVVSISVR